MGDFSIQISSNLVNSLSASEEKPKRKTKRTKPKQQQQPQKPQPQRPQTQTQISEPNETQWPLQPPVFFIAPPQQSAAVAELGAIRWVLEESEKVVEKLEKREEEMVREVTQRARELRDKEFKLPYQKPSPCLAESEACFECYKEHASDPLKCSGLVQRFADCARRVRQQVSSAQL